MPTSGTVVTSASAIDEYMSIVHNPATNMIAWWSGNNPGSYYMNTGALGPRSIPTPTSGMLTGLVLYGAHVSGVMRDYAGWTGVIRTALVGRLFTRWGTEKGHGSWYSGQQQRIARFSNGHIYRTGAFTVSAGEVVNGAIFRSRLVSLRSAQAAIHGQVIDLRVCHDSCHSSCHGSRGRR